MKGLELLNTMALLDGEREFLDNDFSGDIDVSFESGEKAREAFGTLRLSEERSKFRRRSQISPSLD